MTKIKIVTKPIIINNGEIVFPINHPEVIPAENNRKKNSDGNA